MCDSSPINLGELIFVKCRGVWVCLVLVVVTLAVYWRVQDYDFVNIDDGLYVSENQHAQEGLTLKSIIWAFSFSEKEDTYWHPIAWISHALDCRLYGLNPGKHHLTNLMFHIANTLLLFMVFRWMTGTFWRSAFVAALFAIHPINVDTVAWIAERKNVLSTFFWMLTMLAYVYYARQPGLYKYLLTLLMYVLGLLTKPILVTLPFVLLLLDYWPLKRFLYGPFSRDENGGSLKFAISGFKKFPPFQLIAEKFPFFVLSGLSIILSSVSVQGQVPLVSATMDLRIGNALVSYVKYIGKMIWPQGLTVFYPYPQTVPIWEVVGASVLLVCVSIFAIRSMQRAPYFVIGWLWFLGTLVPVLGLVQVGLWPAMADRFAYVPLIGLFMAIVWGVSEIMEKWRYRRICLSVSATVVMVILIAVTWKQVGCWENSITLFEHNLKFSNNHAAHNNLGIALHKTGRTEEAIEHYLKALRLRPDYVKTHNNMGLALKTEGRTQEAIQHYLHALRIEPDFAEAHYNLGFALNEEGRTEDAIKHYFQAIRLKPDSEIVHRNLGIALDKVGRRPEAIEQYLHALGINPGSAEVHYRLGLALKAEGRTQEAIQHYLHALRIEPDFAEAHNNLGNILGSQGKIEEAIKHYLEAIRISSDFEEAHNNLGVALCKKGDVLEALGYFKASLRINPHYAPARKNLKMVTEFQQQR